MAKLNEYAFDCKLVCAIRIKAGTKAEAVATLMDSINANEANLGAWPNGDPILCEVSMDDCDGPHLYEVNGVEVN